MPSDSANGDAPDDKKPVHLPPSEGTSAASAPSAEPVAAPAAVTSGPGPGTPVASGKTAAQLFEEARKSAAAALGQVGRPKVDKYFGSRLPPVCRQLGCYVTDDGKFFYCINPHCHKDRKRETKYNRRRKSVVYFFCPKCKSREIQLHLKLNSYECLDCAYSWKH